MIKKMKNSQKNLNKAKKKEKKENELIIPKRIRIKVVGIGGGGCAICAEIAREIKGVSFLVADSDLRSFRNLPQKVKAISFGQQLTFGLGTGMDLDLAKKAIEKDRKKVEKFFQKADLLIYISSLGGGVGSGAGPVFAQLPSNKKVIKIGIFTLPFLFEGEKKLELAKNSLKEWAEYLSGYFVLENEKIFKISPPKIPVKKALSLVNKILAQYLKELFSILSSCGMLNIDFADLRTILKGKKNRLYFAFAKAKGAQRAEEVIKKIQRNPLFSEILAQNLNLSRILFNISTKKGDLEIKEIEYLTGVISNINRNAKIVFGISNLLEKEPILKLSILGVKEQRPQGTQKKKRTNLKKIKKIAKKKNKDFPKKLNKRIKRSAIEIKKSQKEKEIAQKIKESEWEIPAFLKDSIE